MRKSIISFLILICCSGYCKGDAKSFDCIKDICLGKEPKEYDLSKFKLVSSGSRQLPLSSYVRSELDKDGIKTIYSLYFVRGLLCQVSVFSFRKTWSKSKNERYIKNITGLNLSLPKKMPEKTTFFVGGEKSANRVYFSTTSNRWSFVLGSDCRFPLMPGPY